MQTFPLTSSRTREFVKHEIQRRTVRVAWRREVTASIVRFCFTGDDLDGFTSVGPEDHVRVFFPSGPNTVTRDYTPSEFRPGSGGPTELDLDMVVHGSDGPASAWATTAVVGDELQIGGPRGSRLAPGGFSRVVLAADSSGLPALRRWLWAYQGKVATQAVVFGSGRDVSNYFNDVERRSLEVILPRGGNVLRDAVSSLRLDTDTFIWAAGEADALLPLRRWLKSAQLPAENVSLHGYWRRGEGGLGDHVVIDPEDEPRR